MLPDKDDWRSVQSKCVKEIECCYWRLPKGGARRVDGTLELLCDQDLPVPNHRNNPSITCVLDGAGPQHRNNPSKTCVSVGVCVCGGGGSLSQSTTSSFSIRDLATTWSYAVRSGEWEGRKREWVRRYRERLSCAMISPAQLAPMATPLWLRCKEVVRDRDYSEDAAWLSGGRSDLASVVLVEVIAVSLGVQQHRHHVPASGRRW
jgi:hypothetical protein